MATTDRGPWEGLTIADGRYQHLTTLGEGGMGYVYRAHDRNLKTDVVIKTPRRSLVDQPEQISRFEQEIGAMIRLSFPHIVPVIDFGRHEGHPFAVMRYLPGGSLEDRVPRDPSGRRLPMPAVSLAAWLPSIAKALDFVHHAGYLHRDVKPPNILFDQHDQAYLSDFGVIKVLGDASGEQSRRLTGEGFIAGTVDYMAPELLTAQAFDGRGDQYALAVTVYEVLSARMPFEGKVATAVMAQHLNQTAKPLSERVPGLPAAISAAVVRAMSKAAQQRFGTCSEFASAVLQHVAAAQAARPTGARPAETTVWKPATTAVQPQPRPAAETKRKTVITAPFAPNASPPVPATTSNRVPRGRRQTRWWGAAAAGVVAVIAVPLFWSLSSSSSDSGDARQDPAWGPNPLPKLMAGWKDRADAIERAGLGDSRALLADPKYSSAAELAALLGGRTTDTPTTPGNQTAPGKPLDALEQDLTSMAEIHQRRTEQLEQYRRRQSASLHGEDSSAKLDHQDRELKDQASQLLTLARRLKSLKETIGSPQGIYDAGATAELAVLRDMEAAVAANERPKIGPKTLDRAAELATARNQALAWMAVNLLARSDNPELARTGVKWMGTYSPDDQAKLCWSLLLSGQSESIGEAVAHLRTHPELVDKLERPPLLKLVSADPDSYQGMLPLLVGSSRTSEERYQLFQVQTQVMNADQAAEIEKACDAGLLGELVEEMVREIVTEHRDKAYALAERLVDKHGGLAYAKLSPAEVKSLAGDAPGLAGKLVEQFLLCGNEAQRTGVLSIYSTPQLAMRDASLRSRLKSEQPADPTGLLNLTLASEAPRLAELAEFLLTSISGLQADQVKYSGASKVVLGRGVARSALLKLAWQVPGRGRAWTLEQLLGVNLVEQLRKADATRKEQLTILATIVPVLDGKLVTLKNVGVASGKDRGLHLEARQIAKLPKNVDPATWTPDAAVSTSLVDLHAKLDEVRKTTDPLYADALAEIDRYVADLVTLNTVTFEVANVYDIALAKQLPGAQRELQLKRLDAWDFRFPAALIETFQRERTRYQSLTKSLETARESLVVVQQPSTG